MFRLLGLVGATCAAVLAFAAPARAQETVYGAYCGEVTWAGQAPVDAWVIFMTGERWSSPLTAGPFTSAPNGARTQNGTLLTMTSDGAPGFAINASATNGRIVGEVTASDGRRGMISMTQMRGAGAGISSSPLPPDFSAQAAQEVLNGNVDSLQRAITWAWTPQGSDYWRAIFQGARIPDHAANALRDWVRRAEAHEQPVCDAQ